MATTSGASAPLLPTPTLHYSTSPLLQHPIIPELFDGFRAIANYIAQHGLRVTAKDGEFPPAGQFGVSEMERKTGEYDRPQPWILDGDNESAVF